MAPHTSNSVLKKLFLMLTGLVLVVLTALVSLFTVYIRQQREAEISSQVNRVTNSAAIIAERFNAVFTAQTQLLNDKRVAKLAHGLYTDNYEKTTLILDLLAAMQNMQSLNGIIEDIIITLPAQGLELSVKNDYQKKTYSLAQLRSAYGGGLTLREGRLEMNVSSPLVVSIEENYIPDYNIRILLLASYLETFLDTFQDREQEGALWVLQAKTSPGTVFRTRSRRSCCHTGPTPGRRPSRRCTPTSCAAPAPGICLCPMPLKNTASRC